MIRTPRIRDTVYVIGAGFSHGCGYPLTSKLLPGVWSRLPNSDRADIESIIQFHYPRFDPASADTFPNIEQLITQIAVNLDLFDGSRRYKGRLRKPMLIAAREALFRGIFDWFHDLYPAASSTPWLEEFVERVKREQAAIICFNWDLLLDQKLWGSGVSASGYGLTASLVRKGPFILKPHGPLNWYDATELRTVPPSSRQPLFRSADGSEEIGAFLHPRPISSTVGRRYVPLIVTPTYIKDFNRPIYQQIWKHATDVLSTPKRIVFLGYSLPPDDLQARFILRCGFHSQLDGPLRRSGRQDRTGNADVFVVNPLVEVVDRVRQIANDPAKVVHVSRFTSTWTKRLS